MLVLKLCLVLLLVAPSYQSYDEVLNSVLSSIDADKIGAYIKRVSAKPRNTQSAWNLQVAEDLKREWKAFGLKVVSKKYKVMQSFPKKVDPSFAELLSSKGVTQQTFREDGEPSKGILPAYNAFSKDGSAEGKPVYVNYGRKEDFALLKERGVEMKGCIGLARYGKIFRGDKAALAEQYGMVGLIIYNDGADYAPEGDDNTWPNGAGLPYSGIQRGTLLQGLGDPSTYLYPSTEYASHDSGDDLKSRLPGIVVMPISFENALLVLKKMRGDVVSEDWQGGGEKEYKYGPGFSGNKLDKLRITVNIETRLTEVENIFGIIKGDREPDRWVMMGNHRDTWVQGAVDASTGLATMYEIARALSPHLKSGWRPRRTLVLCSWAAEEQGLMGSTEFVEDYRALLSERAVAYINVDCPVTGNFTFSPKATPNFKPLLERVMKDTKANFPGYKSYYEQWSKSSNGTTEAAILGSGSDFAAFLQMVGVSAIDLSVNGPYYTYHTQYDNFEYFKTHIDPGFGAMKAITQVGARLFIDLACSKIIPLNAVSYATRVQSVFNEVKEKMSAGLQRQGISLSAIDQALAEFVSEARLFEKRKNALRTAKNNWLDVRRINDKIQQLERSFINPPGLPERPQNRHILFAPSQTNAYGGSVYPGIADWYERAVESGRDEDWNEVRKQITIATWVTKAATRTLSNQVFPKM